jgi:hypothetical protein
LAYDTTNNGDSLGAPEYPIDTLYPALGSCLVFTEPGILVKSNGIYVSLGCFTGPSSGKVILLRCDHDMGNCTYLGDFVDGSEANTINASYDGFSASELVSTDGLDYLIVTPTISAADQYRGCVAYEITDLDTAAIERNANGPVASLILEAHGDFNGACGYIKELTGSGIIMSEAFAIGAPTFRLFTTDAQL